jgi:hypothetical protein
LLFFVQPLGAAAKSRDNSVRLHQRPVKDEPF